MLKSRRKFIKQMFAYGLTLTSGFLYASLTYAQWLKDNFISGTFEETITRLFKDAELNDSHKIKFSRLPRVAENGAVVPITISSELEKVAKISLLVKNNPHPLIAEFYLSPAIEPLVSARFKMAKTSDVVVIVEADGKLYRKSQKVKITVGGCG